MRFCVGFAALLLLVDQLTPAGGPAPKPLVSGLTNPTSAVAGPGGTVYVAVSGEAGKDGTGAVLMVDKDFKAVPFAGGLDDPKSLVSVPNQKALFVADKNHVTRLPLKGKAEVYVPADAFPTPPTSLNSLYADPEGGKGGITMYVSDAGDVNHKGGAVYKIAGNKKVTAVVDQTRWPDLKRPGAIVLDGQNHLLLVDAVTGILHRISIQSGKTEEVAAGLGHPDGMTWDKFGRLYISDSKAGKVFVIGRAGAAPVLLAGGFQNPVGICLDGANKSILVTDRKAGTVTPVTAQVPGAEVDFTPMALEFVPAFPKLKWANWASETPEGKRAELRPIAMAHANDGSNRVFVATSTASFTSFPTIRRQTRHEGLSRHPENGHYNDKQNEEGFLGLAFHPQVQEERRVLRLLHAQEGRSCTNVVSRFRVSKDDPNQADPASEEVLCVRKAVLESRRRHPLFRARRLSLRHHRRRRPAATTRTATAKTSNAARQSPPHRRRPQGSGKNYAIPKDNPFVGQEDASAGDLGLWPAQRLAHGLRPQDRRAVGRRRRPESLRGDRHHRQGRQLWLEPARGPAPLRLEGVGPRKDLIDPIWEYHHQRRRVASSAAASTAAKAARSSTAAISTAITPRVKLGR